MLRDTMLLDCELRKSVGLLVPPPIIVREHGAITQV
jgi:hypothetical protein